MTGVTPTDVERFFHQVRTRRKKPYLDSNPVYVAMLARALREQAERERAAAELAAIELAAELDAYERSLI